MGYAWAIEQISTNLKKQCQTKHPPNVMQLKINFKRQLLKSILQKTHGSKVKHGKSEMNQE